MLRYFQQKNINGMLLYDGPNFYIIEYEWLKDRKMIIIYVILTKLLPAVFLLYFLNSRNSQVAYSLCFYTSVALIIIEIIQMKSQGLVDYLTDFMNILDLAGNIFGLIWLGQYNTRCLDKKGKLSIFTHYSIYLF